MYYTHALDPILLKMGPLQIRWYGLMYLVGFTLGYFQLARRYRQGIFRLDPEMTQVLISYLMIGMMIGARLVYVLVYNPMYYMEHPSEIPAIWQGGLSYHGAALGFVAGMLLFGQKFQTGFYHLTDAVVLASAVGVIFGRLGNFINGELFGRASDVPWAVIFPMGGPSPRHPSQLYQALGEGLLVFVALKLIEFRERAKGFAPKPDQFKEVAAEAPASKKKNARPQIRWERTGILGTSYLMLYGLARFVVEFFREPDAQLGFFAGWITMGQILCLLMILAGGFLLLKRIRNPIAEVYPTPQVKA